MLQTKTHNLTKVQAGKNIATLLPNVSLNSSRRLLAYFFLITVFFGFYKKYQL